MSDTEVAILKILFPPDGAVPADRIDDLPAIREHIAALTDLSAPKPLPPEPNKKCITQPEVSQEATLRIVELRDHPDNQGHRRTWTEVADELGTGLSAEAARHRYKYWKAREKKKGQSTEVIEAISVEAAQEGESTLHKQVGSHQERQHQEFSPIDIAILGMADRGALNHEICIAISRKFARNFSTGEMANRIRKLREGRA